MIRSIELTNWKTHKNTKLEFQKGVNVLVGIMGSGKSSILDAITFALFGDFPALNRKNVKLADILTSRPVEETVGKICLTFNIDENKYRVVRTISKRSRDEAKQSEAKLEKNGEYIQAQAERVTEEIERLLKIDYDTFTRAIYSEQNNLEYFLNLTKGVRKKEMDGMLGLDAFAKAKENAISVMNNLNSLVKEQERIVTQIDVKTIENDLKKLNEENSTVKIELEGLDKALQKSEKETKVIESRLKDTKEKYRKKLVLSNQLSELNSKIKTLEQRIKDLGELDYDPGKLKMNISDLKKAKDKAENEVTELEKKKERLTKEIAEVNERTRRIIQESKEKKKLQDYLDQINPNKLKEQIKFCTEQIQKSGDSIAAEKNRLKEAEGLIEIISREISICPICERDMGKELKAHLHGKKGSEITKLRKGIDTQAKQLEKLKKESEVLMEQQNEAVFAQKRIEEYKDVEKLSVEYSTKKIALEKEQKEISEGLEAKKAEFKLGFEKLTKLEKLLGEVLLKHDYKVDREKTSEYLTEKKKEYDSIPITDIDIDELEKNFRDESSRYAELNSKVISSNRYLENIAKQLEEKNKEHKNYKNFQDRINTYKIYSSNIYKFREALIGTEIALRTSLVSSINTLLGDLWQSLYPYSDYSGMILDASEDDYSLKVDIGTNDTNLWVPVDAVASGGERSVACLALRIALSMVLVPNLRWLILDEPTHNIDSAGINKLIEVFGGNLPNVVDQIFIITHDESLKHINFAKVYTLERDKNASGSTVIVET